MSAAMRVRDAMVAKPRALPATATAQEAAALLVRPGVRAVLVVDGERLVGAVTPAALVERVVAAGLDPRATPVSDIAARDIASVAPDAPVEDAYRLMEECDLERVPVIDGDRLVGVVSRSVLQRRLAEDEPPPLDSELARDP